MGATASLMAAALRPERVRALVLVEPVLYPRLAPLMMRVARLLGRTSDMPDLVAMAEKRRAVFPSFEMALKAYTGRGAFKTWPGEMVRDYLTAGWCRRAMAKRCGSLAIPDGKRRIFVSHRRGYRGWRRACAAR